MQPVSQISHALCGIAEMVFEVQDLRKAEWFYGEVLGFTLTGGDARSSIAEGSDFRLHLHLPGTPGHRGAGEFHFAFTVAHSHLGAIASILTQHGLPVRGPVALTDGITAIFTFDPDGREIEFSDCFAPNG